MMSGYTDYVSPISVPRSPSPSPSVSTETEIGERVFDFASMAPFEFGPGVYTVVGLSASQALEHSSSGDPVIKSKCHDGDNQKWEFIRLGTGYIIRCIQSGLYLDHGNVIQDGTKITMSECPAIWSVYYNEKSGLARISCPNRDYHLDMNPDVHWLVLWEGPSKQKKFNANQWFKLNRLGPPSTHRETIESVANESRRDTLTGATWVTTTTTTTTTRTVVTKVTKRVD